MKRAIIVLVTAFLLVWGPTAGLVKGQERRQFEWPALGYFLSGSGEFGPIYEGCSDMLDHDLRSDHRYRVQRLMEGNAELAALTRPMTAEEIKKAEAQGLSLGSKLVGYIGLAVVTNSKNSVSDLRWSSWRISSKGKSATGASRWAE